MHKIVVMMRLSSYTDSGNATCPTLPSSHICILCPTLPPFPSLPPPAPPGIR